MTMPPAHSQDTGSGKTNGFAITSLVLAILGCTAWLGLIFGFISLSQIKSRGDKGRGLAIAGIVVSILWFVGSVGTFVLLPGAPSSEAALPSPSSSSSPAKTEPHDLQVSDIRPGQCFNDGTNGNGGESEVEELTIVGCRTPHDAQAMAAFEFEAGPWPGDRVLSKASARQCHKRVDRKIKRDPARRILSLSWYLPTKESWGLAGRDRGVLCVVTHVKDGKKLSRPLKAH